MSNTINKIAQRTCTELEGIKISQLVDSYREVNANINITPIHILTTLYNTFSALLTKTYSRLLGLKIHIVEKSYRTAIVTTSRKIIKIIKTYTQKLKLIKQYVMKLKH